jgi:predicted nuclease of predicted toxin-antitoxin system
LGLREADDIEIFKAARAQDVIFVSKDNDLKQLIEEQGPPPKLIWLTCGNTSNTVVKEILRNNFEFIISSLIIDDGYFIEITF